MDDAHAGSPAARHTIVRNALSIGIATGVLGISFGVVASAAGLSVLQSCALSVLMFTGASQFGWVSVGVGGASAAAAAANAVVVGSRNALYGVRLASLLRLRGAERLAAAQLVIDESTAMATAQADERDSRLAFYATGLAIFVLWNLGTVAGALGASALSDPVTLGFDAAVPATFVALLAPQLRSRETWAVAVSSGAIALVVTPFVPAGLSVLCAAGVVIAIELVRRP
jgi:predicted branched-subunit amino acid permease